MTATLMNRRDVMRNLGAGGLTLGLASLAGPRALFAQDGRTLIIRNERDISNLDPAMRGGWYDETVMFAIFCGLVRYTPGDSWKWQLDAAESIDDSDPLNIAFKLRPGIMFTGGHGEVTAEDVKFSYERFLDPKVDAVYASDWETLDHVEVTGKYSGVIHLKSPFAPLFTSTLPHASGQIISKAAVEASGKPTIGTDPLACSGPYQLAEWRPREMIRLTRNPGWTGPESYYDEIQLLPIDDVTAAETAFAAGDLEATQIAINSIPSYKGKAATLVSKPALAYTWLGMNIDADTLGDKTVRRALQLGINAQEVVDATFGGVVKPAHGLVPPPLPGARSKNLYGYDPKKAKQMLADAGKQGLKLSLTLETDPDKMIAAQVIQAQLAEIGVTLSIRQMDSAAMTAEQQDTKGGGYKNIELFLETFTTAPDPSWVTEWFTCKQVGVWNFQRTCSDAWDALNDKALAESDPEKRAAEYVKLQDELEETGAYVFLWHGVNAWVSEPSISPAYSADAQWALLRDFKSA